MASLVAAGIAWLVASLATTAEVAADVAIVGGGVMAAEATAGAVAAGTVAAESAAIGGAVVGVEMGTLGLAAEGAAIGAGAVAAEGAAVGAGAVAATEAAVGAGVVATGEGLAVGEGLAAVGETTAALTEATEVGVTTVAELGEATEAGVSAVEAVDAAEITEGLELAEVGEGVEAAESDMLNLGRYRGRWADLRWGWGEEIFNDPDQLPLDDIPREETEDVSQGDPTPVGGPLDRSAPTQPDSALLPIIARGEYNDVAVLDEAQFKDTRVLATTVKYEYPIIPIAALAVTAALVVVRS